jgi:hypothetical protein
MNLTRFAFLSTTAALAVLCAVPEGAAQSSDDIYFDTPQTLEFQVRVAVAPGTQQVYCYQQDRQRLVGTRVGSSGTVSVPISLPDPVIRCTACNSVGCSTLSPNSAVVVATDPLDMDGNSVVDVRDLNMCWVRVREVIF